MAQSKRTKNSYRSLNTELVGVLEELQRTDLDIDEALKHYERGLQLVKQLQTYLKTAENKITELKAEFERQL